MATTTITLHRLWMVVYVVWKLLIMWSAICHTHNAALSVSPQFFIDRPKFAVWLESSSVFDSDLLPWRLLLGPICGDVLGWVRMLPTPASRLLQSTHPSTGPEGCHLASREPPCCKVGGTKGCAPDIAVFTLTRLTFSWMSRRSTPSNALGALKVKKIPKQNWIEFNPPTLLCNLFFGNPCIQTKFAWYTIPKYQYSTSIMTIFGRFAQKHF